MTTLASTSSLVTSPDPGELSPLESLIMDACNEMHDATANGDADVADAIATRLDDLLDRYEATDAEDHPNPAWACPNQRALALSARGLVDEAIDMEQLALPHADTPRRMEISLGNILDRLVRLDRNDEAVGVFLRASEVAPTSLPLLLTGAQALYGAGLLSEANDIFDTIGSMPELLADGGELPAYLAFESRLLDMAMDLPALAAIFGRFEENRHD